VDDDSSTSTAVKDLIDDVPSIEGKDLSLGSMIEECGDDIEAVDEWGTLTDIFDCTAAASVKVEAALGVASRDVFISAVSPQECTFKEGQLPMNVWDNDNRSVVFLNVSHATPIAPTPVDDKNRNILCSFWIARLAWSPWTMRRPVIMLISRKMRPALSRRLWRRNLIWMLRY
jgi:hypothetical protein